MAVLFKETFFRRNSQVSSEESKIDGVEENYTHLSRLYKKSL